MQASEMHIPNAKCHLIVTRIFSLKVDFETILDLVFQTLGKHFIKVNFSKCSVKNSTQIGGPTLHICPGPRGFLECGTCGRKTRKILGKLGWWVIPIPWIKLCFQDRVKASRLVIGLVLKIFYCSISLLLPDEKPMKPTLFVTDLQSQNQSTEAQWNMRVHRNKPHWYLGHSALSFLPLEEIGSRHRNLYFITHEVRLRRYFYKRLKSIPL